MGSLSVWKIIWLLGGMSVLSVSAMRAFESGRVEEFLRYSPYFPVSNECRKALASIFYRSKIVKDFAVARFLSSFSIGRSDEFLSDDRWMHNMLNCFHSNVEDNSTISFCYDQGTSGEDAVAICIPKECSLHRFQLLERWRESPFAVNGTTSRLVCSESPIAFSSYFNVPAIAQFSFNMFIFVIVLLATIYHNRIQNSTNWSARVLYAFSLLRNGRKLLELPADSHSTITCMFGLRFISMFWTIIGHSFAWIQSYIENVEDYKDDLLSNFSNLWITNFTLAVDTFFVLSATLTSFTWFRKVRSRNHEYSSLSWTSWNFWAKFYRHRVIRLWPAYIYTIATVTFWLSSLHWHPVWPPIDPAIQCRLHGWQNALFLNSLFGNECMGWLWYIGTEFIFYVVSPIFLLSLKRSVHFGLFISLATVLFSNFLNALIMSTKRYPPSPLIYRQYPAFNGTFAQQTNEYYVKPQYRISPYVIGILLGYVLARFQTSKQRRTHSVLFQVCGWTLCCILAVASLYGNYPAIVGWDWPMYHVLYGCTFRSAWALSMAWIIYACRVGIAPNLNAFLSFRLFLPLSSLSYSVYLIHLLILSATFLWSPFPMHYAGKAPIFALCVPQLVLSYIAAFVICTNAELPALNLERVFFPDSSKKTAAYINSNCRQPLFILGKK